MAKPRIVYNSKTIDFTVYPWTLPDEAPRGLQESKTVSGIVESMNSRQDVAGRISLRNFRNSDATDAALKRNLKQWLSWAQKGLPWYLAYDSGEMVLTTLASAPAAGATQFNVTSPSSIVNYYSAVMADAPSIYYRMNEPSGGSAADSSGNGLTGTYQGSPTLGVAGPFGPTAVTFDGSTQYVSRADTALADPGNTFSLEAWIKHDGVVSGMIFDKGTGGGGFGYWVDITAAGTIEFGMHQGGGNPLLVIATSTINVPAGVWAHLAVTKSGTTSAIYVNGVNVTGAVTDRTISDTTADLNIGRNVSAANRYYAGSLAEVAIYATALSAARVLAHVQAGSPQFGLYVVRNKEDVDLVKVTNLATATVTVAEPLNFAYAIGDRFRSERYWPARLADGKNPIIERPPGFWDFELPFTEDVNNL